MKLKELLKDIEVLEVAADLETEISDVAYDSRKVRPGSLFVAIAGFASDGNRFIPMALQKGAAAVVTAHRPQEDIPYILVRSDRLALALIGINWYGHPAESMTMIGVTGTNEAARPTHIYISPSTARSRNLAICTTTTTQMHLSPVFPSD